MTTCKRARAHGGGRAQGRWWAWAWWGLRHVGRAARRARSGGCPDGGAAVTAPRLPPPPTARGQVGRQALAKRESAAQRRGSGSKSRTHDRLSPGSASTTGGGRRLRGVCSAPALAATRVCAVAATRVRDGGHCAPARAPTPPAPRTHPAGRRLEQDVLADARQVADGGAHDAHGAAREARLEARRLRVGHRRESRARGQVAVRRTQRHARVQPGCRGLGFGRED